MNRFKYGVVAAAITMCCWQAPAQDLDADKVSKIDAAIPAKAPADPKSPRKVLIYTRAAGFVHSSIPYGGYAIEQMGKKTGAYEGVVSNNPEVFAPDSLAQFDGIILVSTTKDLFEGDEYKESLLNFVRSGKGLVGIHAATDCFYKWDEFGEMIGGYFDGHPWNSNSTVTVKIDDPAHPINSAFGGQKFDITDEIYQFAPEPYSRETHRVLLSLDTSEGSKTDMTRKGIKRKDGDFAVAWVKRFGEGRVFYCSLGHNEHIYWNPNVLKHYLAGIQYALGDLEADATPSAKLDQAYLNKGKSDARKELMEAAFAGVYGFHYMGDAQAVKALEELVVEAQNGEAIAKELRPRLVALLNDATATRSSHWLAAKHLNRIGDASIIPDVAPLLTDPVRTRMARYAIQRIDDPAAHDAIVNALGQSEGAVRIGLINAAGQLRIERAVLALTSIMNSANDATTIAAAASALGKIATPSAARALNDARARAAHPTIRNAVTDALLLCADTFAAEGGKEPAQAIYSALNDASGPAHVRSAALQGLAAIGTDEALGAIMDALKSNDPKIARAGVSAVASVDKTTQIGDIAYSVNALPASTASAVIGVLASKNNAAAFSGISDAIDNENADVRIAAIHGIGELGGQAAVRKLNTLALRQDDEGAAAREVFANIAGRKVDGALADQIANGDSSTRKALIPVLVARRATNVTDALVAAAGDADAGVRTTAIDAIAELDQTDAFPEVLKILLNEKDENVRNAAGTTLTVLASSMDRSKAARHVITALELDATDETAPALYGVLRRIGGDQALEIARAGLNSESEARQDAALRALAQWPTPEPMMDLLALAENAPNDTHRTIAFRGFLDQAAKPNGQPAGEKLAVYEKALSIAPNEEEHKRALAALADVRDERVLDIVKPYLEKEAFKSTAEFVIDKLQNIATSAKASHNAGDVDKALDGNPDTRWTSGQSMSKGMWYLIDLGWQKTVTKITLDARGSNGDYPRGFEVYLHDVEDKWGTPVVTGEGNGPVTEIDVPPTPCRFVRIVQTGEDGLFWSIHELKIETQ